MQDIFSCKIIILFLYCVIYLIFTINRFLKLTLFIAIAALSSCIDPYSGQYQKVPQGYPTQYQSTEGGYNQNAPFAGPFELSESRCFRNPYVYSIDPHNWQQWEKNNYYNSCTTQGGYSY
jgi:hypothetical protein